MSLLDTVELLPCPFCGATPAFPNAEDVIGTCYDAGCEECGIAGMSLQIIDCFDYPKDHVQNSWNKETAQYGLEFIEAVRAQAIEQWNTRPQVESLLSQCRKEARKEALLEAKQNLETLIKLKELIVRYTNERWHSAFARDWADDAASNYAKKFKELLPELRRMAESDKTTMEGEKE